MWNFLDFLVTAVMFAVVFCLVVLVFVFPVVLLYGAWVGNYGLAAVGLVGLVVISCSANLGITRGGGAGAVGGLPDVCVSCSGLPVDCAGCGHYLDLLRSRDLFR